MENSNVEENNNLSGLESKEKKDTFFPSVINRLIGVFFIMVGAIGYSNYGFLGGFLMYASVFCFGIFAFLLWGLSIVLGLLLLIKGKWPKFRINFTGLGYFMLFLFGCLASSLYVEGLSITTFGEKFSNDISAISSNLYISNLADVSKVGGGFVGYLFASLFLTGLGKIGTMIFTYLFLAIGAFLVLRLPVIGVINDFKRLANEHPKKAVEVKSEPKKEETANIDDTKTINPFHESSYKGPKEEQKEEKPVEKQTSFFGIPRKTVTNNQMNKEPDSSINLFAESNKQDEDSLHRVSKTSENPFSDDTYSRPQTNSTFKVTPSVKPENKEASSPFKEEEKPASSFAKEPIRREENVQPAVQEEKKEDEAINPAPVFQRSFTVPKKEKPVEASAPEPIKKAPAPTPMVVDPMINPAPIRYPLPSINLLVQRQDFGKFEENRRAAEDKIPVINGVFSKLGIGAEVESYTIGPSVTRFNIKREPGVRVSQISNPDVESEMKIDLKGDMSVRIEAVVRGQDTSGVEIGNVAPTMVSFKDCFGAVLKNSSDKLLIPLGEDISSEVITTSLDDLPHLLIAGTTGSGKSVFIHSLIMTLIMRNYPDELKLILIDPKQVEFTKYSDMPHLYCPIVTNVVHAVAVLKKLVSEMERRFAILARYECSKIQEYNKMKAKDSSMENLPVIVCIIDEFADMMGQDPKNVDALTQRLAQKARAAGIYLIISTQRPSVKCITGTIKSNIPARIALYLPSNVDSRTILDEGGAEALLGKGDLLARIPSLKSMIRLQSAYVSEEEIRAVVGYLKAKAKPSYNQSFLNFTVPNGELGDGGAGDGDRKSTGFDDELYPEIKDFVIRNRVASTSSLQRRFQVGYGRAANILDALEEEGIIRTVQPGNRKEVIVSSDDDDTSDDGSIGEDNINTGA